MYFIGAPIRGAKLGCCLLSNTCLAFGIEVIARLEQRSTGVTWTNVVSPLSIDEDLNLAWVIGMFLIDSIIYMTIAWCGGRVWFTSTAYSFIYVVFILTSLGMSMVLSQVSMVYQDHFTFPSSLPTGVECQEELPNWKRLDIRI